MGCLTTKVSLTTMGCLTMACSAHCSGEPRYLSPLHPRRHLPTSPPRRASPPLCPRAPTSAPTRWAGERPPRCCCSGRRSTTTSGWHLGRRPHPPLPLPLPAPPHSPGPSPSPQLIEPSPENARIPRCPHPTLRPNANPNTALTPHTSRGPEPYPWPGGRPAPPAIYHPLARLPSRPPSYPRCAPSCSLSYSCAASAPWLGLGLGFGLG